jgi:hypothetical protein
MADDQTEQYQAKWNEYQLGQLASLAHQRVFHIPRFQRDFVWSEAQIKLLADSVGRNYPIGSLLLLAENRSTLQLAGRPISALLEAEDTGQDAPDDDPGARAATRFHVLDGQQRLTSLVRVFANISPKKIYYVDLVKVLESFGPDYTEESDWLISRQRPKDPKASKDKGRLVRADVILDVKKTSLYLDEFIDEVATLDLPKAFQTDNPKEEKAKRREAKATLVQVFETIRNYRVPAIVIDRESPLSAICRIFETINSTGRRLTTFDLAVASFYPEPDLRTLWDESLKRYPRIQRYDLDGERVLQLLVLHDDREATRSAILGMTTKREYVQKQWDSAASALDRALKWAEDQGARAPSLPSEPIIISVASFLYADGAEAWLKRTAGAYSQLERWYFSKLLQPGSKAASNYKIGKDYQDLLAWFRDERPLPMAEVRLSGLEVITLAPSDLRYKAIFSLLVRDVKQDIRSQSVLGPEDAIEDHHIFPRSFNTKHRLDKRKLDGVANRLPISKASNLQINNRPPQEYFEEILRDSTSGTVSALLARAAFGEIGASKEDFLRSLAVPKFEDFILERAERLLDMVQSVLNGLLVRAPTGEMEDA